MDSHFLPERDSDRATWLTLFSNRVEQYAEQLHITPEQLESLRRDAKAFSYAMELQEYARHYSQAVTALKNMLRHSMCQTAPVPFPAPVGSDPPEPVRPGIFNRVRVLVGHIRMQAAYTDAIGYELQIINRTPTADHMEGRPDFRVELQNGYPVLTWKKSLFPGVHIYVNRQDGNGFVLIRRTVKRSFTDKTPLPEGEHVVSWSYRMRYLKGDDETGLFSDTVMVRVVREV